MQLKQHVKKAEGITLRLAVVIVLFLIILFVFWFIADEVVLEKENNFDLLIFQKLSFLTSPFATRIMLFITFFGSNMFLRPAYLLLMAYFLFFKKNTKVSLNIIAIGVSGAGILNLVKFIFKRVRPSDPLIQNVTGFSFPSGHSFSAFTFFGILVYIVWKSNLTKLWKYLLSVFFALFASLVAFSRVYLHVHYPSDIVAGFCLSMLWLCISFWILNKINARFNI